MHRRKNETVPNTGSIQPHDLLILKVDTIQSIPRVFKRHRFATRSNGSYCITENMINVPMYEKLTLFQLQAMFLNHLQVAILPAHNFD